MIQGVAIIGGEEATAHSGRNGQVGQIIIINVSFVTEVYVTVFCLDESCEL